MSRSEPSTSNRFEAAGAGSSAPGSARAAIERADECVTAAEERRAFKETLALIGARASGKTTVGRLAAERLGWAFEDLDEAIERQSGRTIAALFETEGEPRFRDLEAAAIAERVTRSRLVLSTGGGAILRPENRRALRDFGPVVWLRADPSVLAERLQADPRGRPSLTGADPAAEIAQVLRDRVALYHATADLAVSTEGRTVEGVVAAVLDALRRFEAETRGSSR